MLAYKAWEIPEQLLQDSQFWRHSDYIEIQKEKPETKPKPDLYNISLTFYIYCLLVAAVVTAYG